MKKVFLLGLFCSLLFILLIGCKKSSAENGISTLEGTKWERSGSITVVDITVSYRYIWHFKDSRNMTIQAFSKSTGEETVTETEATYSTANQKLTINYQYPVLQDTAACELIVNYAISGKVMTTSWVNATCVMPNGDVVNVNDLVTSENQYMIEALKATKGIYSGKWNFVE